MGRADVVIDARAATALLLLLAAVCAGCVGSAPSPESRTADDAGASVWVVDHGWHAGLVLAASDAPADLRRDLAGYAFLELGWGDVDFYQARDAGLALALRAALASRGSVLHVVGLGGAAGGAAETVRVGLSRAGLAAVARFAEDSLARDADGRLLPLGPGLVPASRFYSARGRYRLLYTCNTWVAAALQAGGAPVSPTWAATAGGLMRQVRRLRAPA
jgi:uncharacterized protein (TIGR02117 family)